jgi:hypothetical protein
MLFPEMQMRGLKEYPKRKYVFEGNIATNGYCDPCPKKLAQ